MKAFTQPNAFLCCLSGCLLCVRHAGASHVAQALQYNTHLKVLDLSGNAVSADTCLVLQEALQVRAAVGS